MSLKRFLLCMTYLILGLSLATMAQAKNYSLAGSAGQLHIGDGLALPIQAAATVTGAVFPPLLIPAASGATAMGTTAMATQQKLSIPAGVLSKPAAQVTVGVLPSNPTVNAVGTNLQYSWPATAAVFSTGVRTAGTQTVVHVPSGLLSATYTPVGLVKAFGGAARFSLTAGPAAGLFAASPVSVYLVAGGSPAPCTHTNFGGADPGCRSLMVGAYPASKSAIGGPVSILVSTPGTPALAASVALKMGLTPPGTIINAAINGPGPPLTNMATSNGFPFTAGRISLSAGSAVPAEAFTLTGMDSRTAGGGGTIQMVAGALSVRPLSGPNANRGWIRLVLTGITAVPTMSPSMLTLTLGALVLLAIGSFGYIRRRSTSA